MGLFNNKGGNILDWFFIIAILLLVTTTLIICLLVVNKVDDSGIFSDNVDAQTALDSSKNTILNMDNMFLFIIIGLSIFTIVSAAMVWNHPAFFFIGLILLAIAVILAAFVSNSYQSLTSAETISETAENFPKINFIMEYLPYYVSFMGIITAIVSYLGFIYAQ